MTTRTDHGWAGFVAGVESDESRLYAERRAKELDRDFLLIAVADLDLGCVFPGWKREIYAAELQSRRAEGTVANG